MNISDNHVINDSDEQVISLKELSIATNLDASGIFERYKAGQIQITDCDIRTIIKTGEKLIYGGRVTQSEFDRCVTIARTQQGKPTPEQQDTTIAELRAENEALKKQLSTTEKGEQKNSLNKSKALIKALYELAKRPLHKTIIDEAEKLGFSLSSDTITNRLK